MGDFVWFITLNDNFVNIIDNDKKINLKVSNCCFANKYNDVFYFLNGSYLFSFYKKREIHKFYMLDKTSNKFIIDNKIYVSGEDSGSIYVYDFDGNILNSIKLGEHISDFSIKENFLYVITYHDNYLIKTDMKKIYKTNTDYTPQQIIVDKYIYVLSNNENYSYISQYDFNLKKIKRIKFLRQIGNIFKYNNKIIYNGSDYNLILNINLNILSYKKSTGESLCRFSDIPIFESGKKFDIINNIIYP